MPTTEISIDPETRSAATAFAEPLGMGADEVIKTYILEPLTIPQAAEIAKVSTRTLNNWLRSGLGHCKIGRIVRISRIDLYTWLNRHKSLSPSTPVVPAVSLGKISKRGRSTR